LCSVHTGGHEANLFVYHVLVELLIPLGHNQFIASVNAHKHISGLEKPTFNDVAILVRKKTADCCVCAEMSRNQLL